MAQMPLMGEGVALLLHSILGNTRTGVRDMTI